MILEVGRVATSQKNSGKRKSSTSNKSSGTTYKSNQKTTKKDVDYEIRQEVMVLLSFCVVLVLFLCMINVVKGAFGPAVKGFMLGVFGLLAYLIPIIAFIAISFKISNHGNTVASMKLVAALLLFFMVGVFISFLSALDMELVASSSDAVKQLYDYQGGGGVIFGGIACLLYKIFGQAGTIFLAVLTCIICLVIVTERSFLHKVQDGSRKIYENSKKMYQREDGDEDDEEEDFVTLRKQERLRKREEEAQKRKEQEQKQKEEKEKEEEERILNASLSKHKKEKKESEIDINLPSMENFEPVNSKDDIHEIRVLSSASKEVQPALPQKSEEKAKGSFGDLSEIKISRTDDYENPAKENSQVSVTENIPEPILSGVTVSGKESSPAKPISPKDTMSASSGLTQDFGSENRSFSAELSFMPEPVTERSHMQAEQKNAAVLPMETPKPVSNKKYEKPKLSLLKKNEGKSKGDSDMELKETALLLQQTLKTFGVAVTVTDISQGPSVTRYELQLGEGVKVNKIVNLADDIKLNLAAQDIRIEAPIPGKAAVGIEIPNKETSEVLIRDLLENSEFKNASSDITFAVGKDISGKTIVADIAKMPHMLVAGATGSGKSVCINTLIMSILYKAHPDDVKLIMIDPKVVELSIYNGIPHLLIPVVTDPRKANAALQWAVAEMTKRYQLFADFNCRDLKGYNQKLQEYKEKGEMSDRTKLPQIIVIVDELADLMMVASKEVEESICRLAQLARAAGIHLIIATQRPSVDVITGLIKANMPSRVAFKVTSGIDSRTILDMVGAEKLLGKGDMLFYPQGYTKPLRVQGAFVSDQEVANVVEFLKKDNQQGSYDPAIESQISGLSNGSPLEDTADRGARDNSYDAYFDEACRFVVEKEKASSGMLQRVFKIGFTRAARIVDQMEEAGVVGAEEGTKPRKVLMNSMELEEFLRNRNGN